MLDYFLEQPGRFSLSEAFFANQQALVHRLVTCFPDFLGDDHRLSTSIPGMTA
jgi:hypothetical protein